MKKEVPDYSFFQLPLWDRKLLTPCHLVHCGEHGVKLDVVGNKTRTEVRSSVRPFILIFLFFWIERVMYVAYMVASGLQTPPMQVGGVLERG